MGGFISRSAKVVTVTNVVNDLQWTKVEREAMLTKFKDEMSKGLQFVNTFGAPPDISSLRMISSHIQTLPSGKESGIFFAVDLGGTNLRVLRVTLKDGETSVTERQRALTMDQISSSNTCENFFNVIADVCAELTFDLDPNVKYSMGFTFSFPVAQTGVNSGLLLEWTKGFQVTGCVGKDPAQMLQDALNRFQLPFVVNAICNDTVGTLIANAFKRQSSCYVGVIMGTGTNAAYTEPQLNKTVVNTEWGGFNKVPKRTSYDIELDRKSANAGKQWMEKMISGRYMGELARLAAHDILHSEGHYIDQLLKTPYALESAHLTYIINNHALMKQEPLRHLDSRTVEVLKRVGEAVFERSAAIAATALAAVLERAMDGQENKKCEVGIDGSVYTKGPHFNERLARQLSLFYPLEDISIDHSPDGSGLGAALLSATVSACRDDGSCPSYK